MSTYNYQVQVHINGHWFNGAVVAMSPSHLGRYLSMQANRKARGHRVADSRLRRTDDAALYHFDGSHLKALV
jgi:hypothetical protein